MVQFKHLFRKSTKISPNTNFRTIDSLLYDNMEMSMEYEEQKYGEFPPRERLFEKEDSPDAYKDNPILKSLFEHYQPFFEKGIDYISDGKTWNVYPTGSMLWYCNEAFSLCTKLSIDPYPEQYFIDEYYNDIGGRCTQIERYIVLSIVYALLAVNWKVRRQHLKMIDVLYSFLSQRCPCSVMVKCIEIITKTYADNNAIYYEFSPVIDQFGYTLLNVNEGLPEDEEEQEDLFIQMRKKVCNNGIVYGEKFNFKPENSPPAELVTEEAQQYWAKLREKGFIVANSYDLATDISKNQAAYIAYRFSEKLRLDDIWKPFIELWGIKTLAQLAGNWKRTGDYPPRANEIDDVFDIKQEKPKGHIKL